MNKKIISSIISFTLTSSLSACMSNNELSEIDSLVAKPKLSQAQSRDISFSSSDSFLYFDSNKDNKVSKSEVNNMLVSLKISSQESKLFMQEFNSSDESRDGYLNQNEFNNLNSETLYVHNNKNSFFGDKTLGKEKAEKLFNQIKDSENGISKKAFVDYIVKERKIKSSDVFMIENIFVALDSDRSEFLTKEELSNLILEDGKFMKKLKSTLGGALSGIIFLIVYPILRDK